MEGLGARSPGSPGCPLPAASPHPRWRALAGPDGPSRPSLLRGSAAPTSLPARDVQRRRRQGAPGARRGPRPCRLASALPGALDRAWASSAGHFAKCSPSGRRAVGSGELGAAGPDCGERGPGGGRERPWAGHSFRIAAVGPRAGPLPPLGRPWACWPRGTRTLRRRQRAEQGGVFRPGGSAPLCSCGGRPRGAPARPAPLAGLARRGNRARGTRGDAAPHGGGRKGRPAGLVGTSRGHQTLPLHCSPRGGGEGSGVGGTGLWVQRWRWGAPAPWQLLRPLTLSGLALEQTLFAV